MAKIKDKVEGKGDLQVSDKAQEATGMADLNLQGNQKGLKGKMQK